MALTESQVGVLTELVQHYGYIDDWKIDHWRNYNLILEAIINSHPKITAAELKELESKTPDHEKMRAVVTTKSDELFSMAKKIQHAEGLDHEEKTFVMKELLNNAHKLWEEHHDVLDELIKAPQPIHKKPVGRPSKRSFSIWLDYLVIELGSIQKAVNYASDFPILASKNPESLKREYRKYRKAKGEG